MILFLGEREGEGSGGRTERGPVGMERNLEDADRGAHLAVRLTQTIKTAEARIQNVGESGGRNNSAFDKKHD